MIDRQEFVPVFKATCADLGVEFEADKHGNPTLACHRAVQSAICMRALRRLTELVVDAADDSLDADFKYLAEAFVRNTALAWDQESKLIEADLSQRLATWNSAAKRRKFTDEDYDRERPLAKNDKDLARRLDCHPVTLSNYKKRRFG